MSATTARSKCGDCTEVEPGKFAGLWCRIRGTEAHPKAGPLQCTDYTSLRLSPDETVPIPRDFAQKVSDLLKEYGERVDSEDVFGVAFALDDMRAAPPDAQDAPEEPPPPKCHRCGGGVGLTVALPGHPSGVRCMCGGWMGGAMGGVDLRAAELGAYIDVNSRPDGVQVSITRGTRIRATDVDLLHLERWGWIAVADAAGKMLRAYYNDPTKDPDPGAVSPG